jgi:hypothetical protein
MAGDLLNTDSLERAMRGVRIAAAGATANDWKRVTL